MPTTFPDSWISLDGLVAGPGDGPGRPLGEGGGALPRTRVAGSPAVTRLRLRARG